MSAQKLSVVMSTYLLDDESHLEQSLRSFLRLSTFPDELILVIDGPIQDKSRSIINEFIEKSQFDVTLIDLPKNVGRGRARNAGVARAQYGLVGIMDSDDILLPDRFSVQKEVFDKHPEIGLVCAWCTEFIGTPSNVVSIKYCPENHDDIVRDLRFTCCVSNPTIVFRKENWREINGFPDFKDANEDYLFFLRLIKNGVKFKCVQRPLIEVRLSEAQSARRRGLRVFLNDIRFRMICLKEGIFSPGVAITGIILIGIRRLTPSFISDNLHVAWRKIRMKNIRLNRNSKR